MRPRFARTLLAASLLTATPARFVFAADPKPPPSAEPTPLKDALTGSAKSDYEAALLLYDNKDYQGAALKFQSAYDASHDARLLFNVADCEIYLHHYARAVVLLKRYLDEGGSLVTAQRRTVAQDLLDKIQRFTTAMRVVVSEPGAEVFLDEQKIGESPLDKPVVVDIGTHKVRAHKAGFRDATKEVPVGGAAETEVQLTLEREVHEGRLTIHAPAGASIELDGKEVGRGTWESKIASGGHTLRVTAPGMIAYQSEVLVQDNENRTIDVALQPIPVVRETTRGKPEEEEWRGALGGMEFGLRTGYGAMMRGDSPGMVPLWIDLGVRLGRPTYLGIYGQYNSMDASGVCGTDLHGVQPTGPLDIGARTSMQSCKDFGVGLGLMIHVLPRMMIDPWFGFGGSFHDMVVNANVYDPLAIQRSQSADFPSIRANAQIGADIHPFAGYRRFGVGPFVSYDLVLVGKTLNRLDDNSNNNPNGASLTPPTNDSGKNDVSPYGVLVFGVRSAVLF